VHSRKEVASLYIRAPGILKTYIAGASCLRFGLASVSRSDAWYKVLYVLR
jgi:hypothetical protein